MPKFGTHILIAEIAGKRRPELFKLGSLSNANSNANAFRLGAVGPDLTLFLFDPFLKDKTVKDGFDEAITIFKQLREIKKTMEKLIFDLGKPIEDAKDWVTGGMWPATKSMVESGVEVAATVYANLLTDRTLKPLGTWEAFAALMLFGCVVASIAYLFPALLGVPLAIVLAVLYAVVAQWAFNSADIWMPLATPVIAQLPTGLFIGLLSQYLLERRQKRHMGEAIGYYLPENIAKDLTKMRLERGAANKVVYSACLATDMAGFSGLAQKLDPGELAALLNDYFEALSRPLKRRQVDVTEFRADAMMCAWTASEPNIAIRRAAIFAALEVVEVIGQYQQHQLNLRARIGLETGWVYVGHAGGGGHFVYSVVGDCANTASRIEGLNKHLGTRLLASDAVVAGVEEVLYRPLGKFQVVGRAGAVSIVEILAKQEEASSAHVLLCERFAEAVNLFNKTQWQKAGLSFASILHDYPQDGPARFYSALCERYQGGATLPDDPSVIVMDAK